MERFWERLHQVLFKNKNTEQTVAKNTFWIFASQTGGRIIRAIVVIYAARAIGATEYGLFSYVVSLAAVLSLISDLGLNTAFLKKASENNAAFSKYFSNAFSIKAALSLLSLLFVIFLGPLFNRFPQANRLLVFAAIIVFSDTLREFGIAAVRSFQKMELEAIFNITTNIAIVFFGIGFILWHPNAFYLTMGYSLGTLLGTVLTLYILRHHIKTIWKELALPVIKEILKLGFPLALTGILGSLMVNTDTLLLGFWRTATEIGYYGAAVRAISIFYSMLGILPLAAFPITTRFAHAAQEKFQIALRKIIQISTVFIVPLTIGGVILGNQIMVLVFGREYKAGAPSFQILILTLFTNFLITSLGYALVAHNRQKMIAWSMFLGFLSNILFDVLLIPKFGGPGSAAATLINQIVIAGFMWQKTKEVTMENFAPQIGKMVLAALPMTFIILYLKLVSWPVIASIFAGGIVYVIILWLLREEAFLEIKHLLVSNFG